MLLDLHANPGDIAPEEFAQAVSDAGLDAVVVARTNRADGLDAYLDALDAQEIDGFIGVELALDKGLVVFIPTEESDSFAQEDWSNQGRPWTLEALRERLNPLDGAVIANHPYYRDDHPPLGDRIYQLKPLSGVVTRIGQGRGVWDRLADQAAAKRGLTTVATSGGDPENLGAAATVFLEGIESQSDLVTALRSGECMGIEMDDPASPRDRRPPAPPARDDRERGDGRRDGQAVVR